MSNEAQCPFHQGRSPQGGRSNRDWWPKSLDLGVLHQHSELRPNGGRF